MRATLCVVSAGLVAATLLSGCGESGPSAAPESGAPSASAPVTPPTAVPAVPAEVAAPGSPVAPIAAPGQQAPTEVVDPLVPTVGTDPEAVAVPVEPGVGSQVVDAPEAVEPIAQMSDIEHVTTWDWLAIGLPMADLTARLGEPAEAPVVDGDSTTLHWPDQGISATLSTSAQPATVQSFTLVQPAALVSLNGFALDSPRSVIEMLGQALDVERTAEADSIRMERDGRSITFRFDDQAMVEVTVAAR
jgi:hypothetical protein